VQETSTQVPTDLPLQDELAQRKTELARLGFNVLPTSGSVVATRSKFYWDCLLTKLDYVVFVRKVERLTEDVFVQERAKLEEEAKDLDPSLIPRGMQKGTATVVVFLADEVDAGLADRVRADRQKGAFAKFFFPVIVDLGTSRAHYFEKTPVVGGVYYAKFRHLAQRLAHPDAPATSEPLSMLGLGLTLWMFGSIALAALALLLL
jgi:hypothetical protein